MSRKNKVVAVPLHELADKLKGIDKKLKVRAIAEDVYNIAENAGDYWSGVEAIEKYLKENVL